MAQTEDPYRELARQLGSVGAVRRELARSFPHDCQPATAIVLMLLGRRGEMRMSELADLMGVDMSVASRHVTHTVDRGWVDRRPDPLDGRARLMRLTESGERLLAETHERVAQTLARRLDDWPLEDVARLADLLARLRVDLGECERHLDPRHLRSTTPL
ncbi:MarR family winged helix-turn-helix transcriptional regulator [Streptomyces megasporus]|uniref:MarR family winged helix-turn-helix transcriptional regulator n=1 Tax=Streptomyces megasporus TaxID=44060 RepID=UPI0006897891|nr:MarR family transcriptional regulator [Streptomyces megasporus]